MLNELDILKDITQKLDKVNISYMLTGSIAMNYYAVPRMTRDIDIIIEIYFKDIDPLIEIFKDEYYIERNSIIDSIKRNSIFNIIHNSSFIKVDFIIRKKEEYRKIEFNRRLKVDFTGFPIYIVSKEDLIISKLFWAKTGDSDYQLRDVINLMNTGYDKEYILNWSNKLGILKLYNKCKTQVLK